MLAELLELVRSRLRDAERAPVSDDYTRGYRAGSIAELEEIEEFIEDMEE